ncbi:MAG TPA: ABC transporter permease [Firmicutes bacterium]|nr:ABC transporter permease [Bacillota bacterium]
MKLNSFALRNTKEILRDKLNMAFGIGFPVILLLLLTLIQSSMPVELFAIGELTPGIAVFGLSFISLFSGMIIAKDRTSSFMLRLLTSPMTAKDYIFGYTLPLIPMAVIQITFCFIIAIILGLEINVNVFLAIIVLIPASVLFIALGLLCGSVFTEKQVGGVCGALLTNVSAWLSGTWFDLDLVGGAFKTIANLLPFSHAVSVGRLALAGEYLKIMPELMYVIGYATLLFTLAIIVFTRKMSGDSI